VEGEVETPWQGIKLLRAPAWFGRIAATFHWEQDSGVRRVVWEADGLTTSSSGRSIRAVVIEDNAADVYLILEALKQKFVRVELEVFENGAAVSKLVDRLTDDSSPLPDIVLLDLNLPRCDSKEVLLGGQGEVRGVAGVWKDPHRQRELDGR
jgi:hypothetical protein